MARANNSVRFFTEQSGRVAVLSGTNDGARTSENALFSAYSFFCAGEAGVKPVGRARFRAMMDELATQYGVKKSLEGTERIYIGLTLVEKQAA